MGRNRHGLTGWCAATVLVSAFLLFQVQPMVSKAILPWFGGSPAVWTSCMLFFQVFLLLGYLYAHLLDHFSSSRWSGLIHLALLLGAVLVLPIIPEPAWKPRDSGNPQWRILILLTVNVGLPYLLLAATAPLIQAWYSRVFDGRSPYRFYAVSNFGALVALLSYPFWIEPACDIPDQGMLWANGYRAFALLSGGFAVAVTCWNPPRVPARASGDAGAKGGGIPSARRCLSWLVLAAFASMGLLAVTDHICQDVAVVPFLWIVPLSLYLITFILCFDGERWYRRNFFAVLTLAAFMMIAGITFRHNLQPILYRLHWLLAPLGISGNIPDVLNNLALEATLYLLALFSICMLCHGELVRSKPGPRYLTLFYLCISAGGAMGGVFVAMICPRIFSRHVEITLFLAGGGLLGTFVVLDNWAKRERRWLFWWTLLAALAASGTRRARRVVCPRHREQTPNETDRFRSLASAVKRERPWYTLWSPLVPIPFLAAVTLLAVIVEPPRNNNLVSRRSFYGTLRVVEHDEGTGQARRNLYNGRILHGTQLTAPDRRREPTTYYHFESGIGLTLTNLLQVRSLRVAVVGLGAGTVASYGMKGDHYCFYEINPDVIDIANQHFTFLRDSPADIRVEEGDARLSMERHAPGNYDVIALDAFSGDAIPTHLLTVEAMAVYMRHLKPNGVLAVHTSNRHLDLVPIVFLLAACHDLNVVKVDADDEGGVADAASQWLLLTNNDSFLEMPDVKAASVPVEQPDPEIRVWTDHYSNLFQILR
ncbi:MAG: spermidine synthase [Planctomycetota bacterium]